MDRIKLIQSLLTNNLDYLEIGVETGVCFNKQTANTKTAVDPVFRIQNINRSAGIEYYEITSDKFFEQNGKYFDVIFIDGLHTYEQSLKDTINSLQVLKPNGTIVLHDCLPPHTAAATPTNYFPTPVEQKGIKGWTGEWCGDVWKTIVYLLKKYPDLEIYVNNFDYGCGVVRNPKNINIDVSLDMNIFDKVNELTYEDLMTDTSIINLK